MKKRIVFGDGTIRLMECDEEFLNCFRGQAVKRLKEYKNGGKITEDDYQELDIVIFKTFLSYNEVNCFSTHLEWKLKQYFVHKATNASRKKRDSSKYKMLNLDFDLKNNSGDAENNLHELLADEGTSNLQKDIIDREFIDFLHSNLNEFELKLLAVNLKAMRLVDLAAEQNTSKQNINSKNKRFKKKLLALIEEFNA